MNNVHAGCWIEQGIQRWWLRLAEPRGLLILNESKRFEKESGFRLVLQQHHHCFVMYNTFIHEYANN